MRVTGGHILELAAAATSTAQSKVADATEVASSGLRVQVPSDDPVAWAQAQRAKVREALGAGRATTLGASQDWLTQTDGALATIQSVVTQARTIAVQAGNATYDASSRAALGQQVTRLFQAALAAANAQGSSGEYLLAGSKGQTQPFDPTGVYQGDAATRSINTAEQGQQVATVAGSMLTAANGVDVLPELQNLATALSTNNLAGIQTAIGTLQTATSQISSAREQAGSGLAALSAAADATASLDTHLQTVASGLVDADVVTAASNLAQATNALTANQTITAHVISTLAAAINNA